MTDKPTPLKKAQRKYEDVHKDERKKATGQFNTRLPRPVFNEINGFLKKHGIPKTELIYAGYAAVRRQIDQRKEDK